MALVFVQDSDKWPMTIRVNQLQSGSGSPGTFCPRRVPAHGRPADRLLRAAAVLRPGTARRLGQIAAPVHLVPHTHWDREWYLPFQRFRLKLVRLVDGLLDLMEADERYRFTLDGQLADDDYLEVRPEAAERVRRLVEEGRLAIGPWQVLMDEFLVSGETIVRNLECGQRRAAEFGRAMPVGYLPDMFGHVAQMPQIPAGRDRHGGRLERRPAAIDSHSFVWEAPDGSSARRVPPVRVRQRRVPPGRARQLGRGLDGFP